MASRMKTGEKVGLHEMEILYAAINQLPFERRQFYDDLCRRHEVSDIAEILGVVLIPCERKWDAL